MSNDINTNKSKFAVLAVLATVLLSGIFASAAQAVEYTTDLDTNTLIVTDDNGKKFVGIVAAEDGFNIDSVDGAVISGGNETGTTEGGNETTPATTEEPVGGEVNCMSVDACPVPEPATTGGGNETSGGEGEETTPTTEGTPDIVVIPVPTEENETTVAVITDDNTAIVTDTANGTEVTEIDNSAPDGGITNQTTEEGGNVEIIVGQPIDVVVTEDPNAPAGNGSEGGTVNTGLNVTITEGGETTVEEPATTDGDGSGGSVDNGTGVVPPPIQCVTEPCEVTGQPTNGTTITEEPTNPIENGTQTTDGGVIVTEPTPTTTEENCPISGNIIEADGSQRPFKLCYS